VPQMAVLRLHIFCMSHILLDYYSDYEDKVRTTHGVPGKARHEGKMLLGNPNGKWLLGRDRHGRKNAVPYSSTCLCLE
jgi:hypothetical protein